MPAPYVRDPGDGGYHVVFQRPADACGVETSCGYRGHGHSVGIRCFPDALPQTHPVSSVSRQPQGVGPASKSSKTRKEGDRNVTGPADSANSFDPVFPELRFRLSYRAKDSKPGILPYRGVLAYIESEVRQSGRRGHRHGTAEIRRRRFHDDETYRLRPK
jgi:hypothetical protein